jgi:NAD-dependent DNA ligase
VTIHGYPYKWEEMSTDEKNSYLDTLGDRLLKRRYEYYILNLSEISDGEYDCIEKFYERLCNEYNRHPVTDMVGFDYNKFNAQSIADSYNTPKESIQHDENPLR